MYKARLKEEVEIEEEEKERRGGGSTLSHEYRPCGGSRETGGFQEICRCST